MSESMWADKPTDREPGWTDYLTMSHKRQLKSDLSSRPENIWAADRRPGRAKRIKAYTRRVWWTFCDLVTVVKGGDPSK